MDEFHIRGVAATKELIALAEFTPDMHIGSGTELGGTPGDAIAHIAEILDAAASENG